MTVGTGLQSKLKLMEQSTISTLGANQREVYLRPLEWEFDKQTNFVTSDYIANAEMGITKEISHFIPGKIRAEIDMETIVDVLKWMMGSLAAPAQQGGTAEYKHVLKFGTAFKFFKAFEDNGGISSYYNYIGNVISAMTIFINRMDTAYFDARTIGQTYETGASITPSYPENDLTVAWSGFKTYVGAAGQTTISGISTQWKDPYSARIDFSRNFDADNIQSDQLGYTDDITDGKIDMNVNFVTKSRSTSHIATYLAGTEKSLGIVLDTGLPIPSGVGNYKMEIIFPRGRFTSYPRPVDSERSIEPAVNFKPMRDKTAGYSVMINVHNNITTYPDAS